METRYEWIADSGHEWLAVPIAMARKVKGISEYSYVNPREGMAYLEGDCDAALFITHYNLTQDDMTVGRYYDGDAPLRNFRRYEEVK